MAGEYGKELTEEQRETLARGFAEVINCNSIENASNTPDHILGEYLVNCLEVFHKVNHRREWWYGKKLHINAEFDGDTINLPSSDPVPLENPVEPIFPTKE